MGLAPGLAGYLARAEAGFQEPSKAGRREAGPKLVAEALVSPHPAQPPVLASARGQGAVDVSEHVTRLSAAV